MASLVIESERAWESLGQVSYGPGEKEKQSRQYRRSLYIVEDIQAGQELTSKNVRAIRPGLGLPTKYLEICLGKRASKDLKRGTPLDWGHI
tara:strand:- start:806 stop:1078 length:273 start_codon:yes stop_codon:yes gene_type:complete